MKGVITKQNDLEGNESFKNRLNDKVVQFGEFVVLMAMMMSLTALSIDAMLPALAIIGNDLGSVHPNENQLTISSIFIGLSIGQLFYGPISDSTGRKKPLYWGLVIFIGGSVVSIFATSMHLMIAGRVIQGIGLASPRTVSLAMIRDQFKGNEMAKIMSFVMVVFILVPTIAPSIGQGILFIADWKAIFAFILIIALVILLWFGIRMHETLAEEKRLKFSMGRIFDSFKEIIKTPRSFNYTITAGLISSSFIGFLNSSQQIFQEQYGLGEKFPLFFAALALSVGIASFFNGKLVMKYGMARMVKVAITVLVAIAYTFLFITYNMNEIPLWLVMPYFMSTLFCIGILFGNMNSMAMEPLGHIAGVGSAVVGSLSTFISVFIGTLISQQYDNSILPIVIGFAVLGMISLIMIFWTERKHTL